MAGINWPYALERKVDNTCPMCGVREEGRTKHVDVGYYRDGASGSSRIAFRDLPKWLTEHRGALIHTITDVS